MASYRFIKTKLRNNTVHIHEPFSITEDLRGITFLQFPNTVNSVIEDLNSVNFITPPDGSMRARVIISSFDKAYSYISTTNFTIPEAVLIVCKTPSRKDALNFCSHSGTKINIIFTELDASTVTNAISLAFQAEVSFLSAFLRCESANEPLQAVIDTLSERIRCNVYFINSSGIILYQQASLWNENAFVRQLKEDACFPHTMMKQFSNLDRHSADIFGKLEESGLFVFYSRVPENSEIESWLVLVAGTQIDLIGDISFSFQKASLVIETRMNQSLKDGFFEPKSAFQRFMYDLKNGNLQGGVRVEKRLSYLEYPPESYEGLYLRFAVIEFPDKEKSVPYSFVLKQLRLLFPKTNITAFDREVILMFYETAYKGEQTRTMIVPPHEEELNQLLSSFNGYMSFGRKIPYYANLKTHYQLAIDVNSVASTLEDNPAKRVFVFHKYVNYIMIDWFNARFCEHFGYSGLAEFIHPIILKLWINDNETGNNLCDVLYQYLMNDHSLKQTAESLYIHRNTVAYKIKQIENLVNIDLDSIEQCQIMILSCQMLKYMLHDSKNTMSLDDIAQSINPTLLEKKKDF